VKSFDTWREVTKAEHSNIVIRRHRSAHDAGWRRGVGGRRLLGLMAPQQRSRPRSTAEFPARQQRRGPLSGRRARGPRPLPGGGYGFAKPGKSQGQRTTAPTPGLTERRQVHSGSGRSHDRHRTSSSSFEFPPVARPTRHTPAIRTSPADPKPHQRQPQHRRVAAVGRAGEAGGG